MFAALFAMPAELGQSPLPIAVCLTYGDPRRPLEGCGMFGRPPAARRWTPYDRALSTGDPIDGQPSTTPCKFLGFGGGCGR